MNSDLALALALSVIVAFTISTVKLIITVIRTDLRRSADHRRRSQQSPPLLQSTTLHLLVETRVCFLVNLHRHGREAQFLLMLNPTSLLIGMDGTLHL